MKPGNQILARAKLLILFAFGVAPTGSSQAAISLTHTADLVTEAPSSRGVAAADFNRDGFLDLVLTGSEDASIQGSVSVFLGNGDGTFTPQATYALPNGALAVAAADVNSDTFPDLVVGLRDRYLLMLGNGDGSFAPPTQIESIGTVFVTLADLNADGRPDVVATTASSVRIHLGNGDGTFRPAIAVTFPDCVYGEALPGDFNGDGRTDLAVVRCTDAVTVLLGNGDGTFQSPVDYRVSHGPNGGDVGDLNSDGRLDLVVANQHTSTVAVLMGNGDGTFTLGATVPTGVLPIDAALGDLNSDHIPDLVVATYFGSTVEVSEGRGDGTFGPKIGYASGITPSVALGDWDRDGHLDIAASNWGGALTGSRISILRNTPGVLVGMSPVVTAPSSVTGNAGSMITFSVSAVDPDGDAISNLRALQMLDAGELPAGATFTPDPANTSGTFQWTPDFSAQGRSFDVAFVAQNALSGSARTSIFVSSAGGNAAPVLAAIGNKTVNELALLAFTATATDPDAGQTLTFALTLGTPPATGATINATTGAFSWTPTEVQGPGSFPITVSVTDNGGPQLSDAETITVAVNEVDSAPVLGSIGDKETSVGVALSFTAIATDADIPANTLAFSLDAGAPAGATIGGSTGVFHWTPAGAGVFPVTIRVTDNEPPFLSDFEAIRVTVHEVNQAPVLSPIGNKAGTVQALLSFTATGTDPNAGQTLTFSLDAGAPAGAAITPNGNFSWTPACGQNGTFPVTIRVTDNGIPPLSDFEAIAITITDVGNPPPVLATIGNKTVNEGSLLTFTASATDSDAGDVLTFSLDAGAPTDAAINGTSGAFTWTPTEARGPGTYSITVRVTDNGSCPATDWETITVMVNEVNVAPVLAPIGNKTACSVGAPFAFTATATDADVPANVLTFSLDPGAPQGATINASTGTFNWTPSTTGSFPVTVRVTDNGTPALNDFEVVTITVSPGAPNQPPVLGAIGSKTVNELTPLTFTAVASDPNPCPGEFLTFSLDSGAPNGATINGSTGAFSWTPTETQGPGSFPITVRVTDNGSPPLSDSETITVTVNEVNVAPILAAIGNKTGPIGTPITFTATATDADIPVNTLTFSLDPGAPAGATINGSTGAFSFTPTTFANFPCTIRVTDNGNPTLSDFEAINISAGQGGPPVLAAIGNKTVNELALLAFTATATDPNAGDILTFSLDAGAPAGAAISASTGAFFWTPTEAQGPGSRAVTVRVTDNGTPPLSDFETITVTVNEVNVAPVVTNPGNRTVNASATSTFTVSATDSDIPANVLAWSLALGSPAATGATINSSTGAFSWTPTQTQANQAYPVTITVTDNGTPVLTGSAAITISVLAACYPPILTQPADMTVDEGGTADQQLTAADGSGGPLTFSKVTGPAFMTVSPTGNVHLAPGFADLGVYLGTVQVTSGPPCVASDTRSFQIMVGQPLSVPTADAGGPYTGIVASPVNLDGTASFDPAGQVLMYLWDFGDGSTGVGVTPSHTYTVPGTYNVTLRVTNPNGLYDDDTTTATINDGGPAVRLVLKNDKSTLNLGDDVLKLAVEELELPYPSVLVSTVRLSTDFPNAGTVAECAPDAKHTRIGDLDRNGVSDLELRFPIACIRNLFRNTPNNSTVNLILTGQFQTSSGPVPLRAVKSVTIKRGGGGSAPVLAYPNPFNPEGRLSFVTMRPGSASIQLFDLQGRLVRRLLPWQYLGAGAHEITIDGLSDQGIRLSSGVYFYRVQTADGVMEGSISVLK